MHKQVRLIYGVRDETLEDESEARQKGFEAVPYGNVSLEKTRFIVGFGATTILDPYDDDVASVYPVPTTNNPIWDAKLSLHYPDKRPRWWVAVWYA